MLITLCRRDDTARGRMGDMSLTSPSMPLRTKVFTTAYDRAGALDVAALTWRATKKGMRWRTTSENGVSRRIR